MRELTFSLLGQLSHERFVSGESLATAHGVSRASVSEALREARELGIELFSLPRKGYRLAAPLEMLNLDTVRTALGRHARRLDLDIVPVINSTNTALAARLASGAPGGTALAAELQTAGRGRRGRSWHAAFGHSLAFSLGWRFDKGAGDLGGLSLAVGVAIARAINALKPKTPIRLKWPNDIVAGGRKLGGVLIEAQGEMLGPTAVVIGIGLNFNLPEAIEESIDQPVTDLARAVGKPVSRNALLASLLCELVGVLDQFQKDGFAPFMAEWTALHALAGAKVRVHPGNGTWFDAEVRRVAADGALVVAVDGGERTVSSGEVSVRSRA